MNKDAHLLAEAYNNVVKEAIGRGLAKDTSTPAQKLVNTIRDWSWTANQPSPQTGRFYPSTKQFSDGRTTIKLGEMFNGVQVKPQWQQDFNNSVKQWLLDLVAKMHPGINKMKSMLNISDDINPNNQQQYQQSILQTVSQMVPQTPAPATVAQVPTAVPPA